MNREIFDENYFNGVLSYGSSETNSDHRAKFEDLYRWNITQEYHQRTTLVTDERSPGSSYYFWYVDDLDPGVGARYFCTTEIAQSHPDLCRRARVIHNEYYINSSSSTDASRSQGICHEMGHAVGFGENMTGDGCMDGGRTNAGHLSAHEIDHINYCYAFGSC